MIYKNEVLVDWRKSTRNKDEDSVYQEITELRNKYFGEKTRKIVRIVYPKGIPSNENSGVWENLKLYPVRLHSTDGQWRWTSARMGVKNKSRPDGFVDAYKYIRHQEVLTEKDIEFIWFLKNRSADLNKKIFIEDLEGDAAKEVAQRATTVDIEYMILGKTSPIAKDEKLLREVAEIFGVRDQEKMGINQLKKKLVDEIITGEQNKDRFVNFDKFLEITAVNSVRNAAFVARRAISDKFVGYNYKDRSWYLMDGRDYAEKLVSVKDTEAQDRDQVFLDEMLSNASVRDRVYTAMGETDEVSSATLRELDLPSLKRKYNELTGNTTTPKDKKEDVIKMVCDALKIEYVEPA